MRLVNVIRRHLRLTPRNLGYLSLLILGLSSCAHRANRTTTAENEDYLRPYGAKPKLLSREAETHIVQASYPMIQDAEMVGEDEICATCHKNYVDSFAHNVHRGQKCEDCHGPASKHLETRGEPGTILSFKNLHPNQSAEVCLKCHEQNACTPGAQWRSSVHAQKNVTCNDCHRSHYNVPPGTPAVNEPGALAENPDAQPIEQTSLQEDGENLPSLRGTSHALGAIAPTICYRCHEDTYALQAIASPHQIGGEHGFNCTTCHNPHGKILESSRKDLCLQCHTGTMNAAWHSSLHNMANVVCTDCHDPHPESQVQQFVNIRHQTIRRPQRMPMSVDDPNVCYRCHQDIYALTSLPSHHPIKEGKMVCGDCHNAHGVAHRNLKEETVNLVCWRCHADKQGPFVYEHPPVTEDCGICHNPHGTVANNLLHQPTTFLCLRCHTGHRVGPNFGPHRGLTDVGTSPSLQQAFYTDCTNCHKQIHGSDLASPHNPHAFVR